MSNFLKLVLSILICQLAGITGALFTAGSVSGWYATLIKPSFNPPDSVFAPVWTVLYLLMGISMFLIWKEGLRNKEVRNAFILFIVQLVFNTLWTIIFFGAQSVTGGFIVILILWILILICIFRFLRISKTAGMLLIPYFFWVAFAAVLNCYIMILN
ncbi:MAG: tryptophan-rich sensory protein [Ignavibacteria bacterium]|nr:tryptophan-rich sensory protein [Ignavibacteria bacterium]